MTGASKILTVSYGTFSCTLEGFDDPFNTMKAIAEYFRDLAAEDRYFGAEPPTPDAAMLHRIAEREIQRRVEAKIQDNGVILRAAEDGAEAPAPVVAAPRPALAPAAGVSESVAEKLQRIRAKTTPAVAPVVAAVVAAADYSEDEHADDLAPAAEAVAEAAPVEEPPVAIEDFLADAAPLDEGDAGIADHAEPVEAEEAAAVEPDTELAEDLVAADLTTAPQIDLTDALSDLPEAEDFEAPVCLPTDSLSEAEVAEAWVDDLTGSAADDLIEAELTDDATLADDATDLALLDGLTDVLAADALPEDTAEQTETQDLPEQADTAEDEADMLSRLGGLSLDDEDDDADEPEDALYDAQDVQDQSEALPETVIETSDDAVLANLGALISPEAEDEPEAVEAADADIAPEADDLAAIAEAPEAPEFAEEVAAEPEAPPMRARARVIRIRRAEPVAPAAAPVAAPAAAEGALSAEAEAALQAELAALEAELGGSEAAPVAVTAAEPEPEFDDIDLDGFFTDEAPTPAAKPVGPDESRKRLADDAEDDAVNRLIAHANSEMGGEETRRRQSAIAHLKAAVAATVADRKVTGAGAGAAETRIDAYRDDLERVVRPRRPVSEGSTPRPSMGTTEGGPRPTPLVLVSEQRIDRPRPAETAIPAQDAGPRRVQPVRPRRIAVGATAMAPAAQHAAEHPALSPTAAANPQVAEDDDSVLADMDEDDTDNVFSDGASSFGEFAEQLGATALPDLLEAAAVYCAEVLQRPEFSRPLVMRQVAGVVGAGATSREDCLRGFGTLLRQGRIAKVKRGMFALTDRSPFLAEARKIAG